MSTISDALSTWERPGRVMLIYDPGRARPWRLGWRREWRGQRYGSDLVLSGAARVAEHEVVEAMEYVARIHDMTMEELRGQGAVT